MINIIEYLDDKGIHYSTSGKNVSQGWIGIQCVFCGDRSNHLGINLSSNAYSCFVCGAKGNAINLIKSIENTNWTKAKSIAQEYSSEILSSPHERLPAKSMSLPNGLTEELFPIHKNYLESRRFSTNGLLNKYKLQCFGLAGGVFKFRLFIPYFLHGKLITWTTRDVTHQSRIRYVACPTDNCIIPVKQTLYNIDNAGSSIIVVEGVMDVWRIGDGAVALHGIQCTTEQIRLLSKFRKVNILLDYGVSVQAQRIADALAVFTDVEVLELDHGDPAEMSDDDIKYLRRKFL